MGSDQTGRSQEPAAVIPQAQQQPDSGPVLLTLASSAHPPVLRSISPPGCLPTRPSEAAVEEWKDPDWESGTDSAPKCMTSYKSLSLPEPWFSHPKNNPTYLAVLLAE